MRTAPKNDGVRFLVRRPAMDGTAVSEPYVEEVEAFEGQWYPARLDYCISFDDRVTDAIAWCEVPL